MVGPERGKDRGSDESVLVRLGNAAWLVLAVIAFNLSRAAATIAGLILAKATTANIRRNSSSSRPGSPLSATCHPPPAPAHWPW